MDVFGHFAKSVAEVEAWPADPKMSVVDAKLRKAISRGSVKIIKSKTQAIDDTHTHL